MKRIFVVLILGLIMVTLIHGENKIKKLSSDSKDEFLVYPGKFAEGPDGLIYVADYKDSYIKIYSQEGEFVKKVGGKGEGPGQIKRLGSFGFSPDKKHIFFVEYFRGHRWITITDLNGICKNVIKLDFKKRSGVYEAVMLPDGRFLLEIHETDARSVKKSSNYFQYYLGRKLRLINKDGVTEKEFLNSNYMHSISMKPNCCDIEIPFQSVYLWRVLDKKIIFTDGLSRDFKTINIDINSIGKIHTPLPQSRSVTQKELDEWRDKIKNTVAYKNRRGAFSVSGKVMNLYKKSYYRKKPNLAGISLTNEGNILVEGLHDKLNPLGSYWLLDNQGTLISKIRIKAFGLSITKNYFIFSVFDEDENEDICFIKIDKNEKEDFTKLGNMLNSL